MSTPDPATEAEVDLVQILEVRTLMSAPSRPHGPTVVPLSISEAEALIRRVREAEAKVARVEHLLKHHDASGARFRGTVSTHLVRDALRGES